ncbi:type II and III secretion system protein [Thermanaerovibrio acidaminovorans DSM 6589]|uniref:Type II and III secretion system protein n=1 Tax=Thermanaerovibrio acidaminovorans (strain ATCC 49978 / DSM 6589 / Su883) TaxID=525903 RepID=D1B5I4_THEAS|nr:type II and III secretion system protein [Thermanaerovibrio acidaminovorans]ACZ19275.1 type II and III secretion system protein [Thermanaerovibrio acidaminovorans DSM 6589]
MRLSRLTDLISSSGFRSFSLLLLALLAFTGHLGAAWAEVASSQAQEQMVPMIRDIKCTQGGSQLAILEFIGASVANPSRIQDGREGLEVLFPPAVSVDQALPREIQFEYPLLSSVSLRTTEKGLLVVLSSPVPLKVKSQYGGGTNRFVLSLEPREQASRMKSGRVPTVVPRASDGKDPLSLNVPVDLALREVELKDVFRMLGDFSGYNIICDPTVPTSPVTLTVRKVPMKEVFSYLMRTYDITYAVMGRTILVGKADSLAKSLGQEKTKAFEISYGDVKQISAQVQTLFEITRPIAVDERLRVMYVTGRPEQLAAVERFLNAADHPGKQVMLQARIVEVKDDGVRELESVVNTVYRYWWLSFSSKGGVLGYSRINQESVYKNDTNRVTKPGATDISAIAESGGLSLLDAGIKALENADKGKTLASPSVVVVDGKEAKISLTENIKYISARDQAGNPTYSEEKVGPTMEFLPTVGRDGFVTIKMTLKTGEVTKYIKGGLGEEVPQTSTREVTSYVRVRDGEPFVVGGLFRDSNTFSEYRIPVLSDIPLIGELFKSRTKKKERGEVAMIVIPHILDVPGSPVKTSEVHLSR